MKDRRLPKPLFSFLYHTRSPHTLVYQCSLHCPAPIWTEWRTASNQHRRSRLGRRRRQRQRRRHDHRRRVHGANECHIAGHRESDGRRRRRRHRRRARLARRGRRQWRWRWCRWWRWWRRWWRRWTAEKGAEIATRQALGCAITGARNSRELHGGGNTLEKMWGFVYPTSHSVMTSH